MYHQMCKEPNCQQETSITVQETSIAVGHGSPIRRCQQYLKDNIYNSYVNMHDGYA